MKPYNLLLCLQASSSRRVHDEITESIAARNFAYGPQRETLDHLMRRGAERVYNSNKKVSWSREPVTSVVFTDSVDAYQQLAGTPLNTLRAKKMSLYEIWWTDFAC